MVCLLSQETSECTRWRPPSSPQTHSKEKVGGLSFITSTYTLTASFSCSILLAADVYDVGLIHTHVLKYTLDSELLLLHQPQNVLLKRQEPKHAGRIHDADGIKKRINIQYNKIQKRAHSKKEVCRNVIFLYLKLNGSILSLNSSLNYLVFLYAEMV